MRNEKIGKERNPIKASAPLESSIAKTTYDFCEPLPHKRYLKFYFITWYKVEYVNINY